MKIALILFIIFPIGAIAGRSYTINFTVINDVTDTPLEGVRIVCGEESSITFETDKFGNAAYVDCKHEWLSVTITAEGFYKQNISVYSKKAKVDKELTIRMIPTDRPNISVAKLAEMEKIKASYSIAWEEEMKKREQEIATIDTTVIPSCSFGSDDLDESEEELYFDPEFPGGQLAMHRYIANTVEYPEYSIDRGEQGSVFIKFIVQKDGTLTNFEVERGVSQALDAEALRVFQGMPKWVPASCNGRYLKTILRYPINFTLN